MADTYDAIQKEANRLRDDLEADRLFELIDLVEDRNIRVSIGNEWDRTLDDLRERTESEHGPLEITWHGTANSNPALGDAEWTVDYVDVLLGTGGPACGIEFRDYRDARVWWQDWFTPRMYADLSPTAAERLAGLYGLEF